MAVKGISNSALLAFSVSDFQPSLAGLTIIIGTIFAARMRLPFASSFRDYVPRERVMCLVIARCINHATSWSVLYLKFNLAQSVAAATKFPAGDSRYLQDTVNLFQSIATPPELISLFFRFFLNQCTSVRISFEQNARPHGIFLGGKLLAHSRVSFVLYKLNYLRKNISKFGIGEKV